MSADNIAYENNKILNGAVPYTNNPLMKGFTENYFETKDNIKLRFLHKGEGMPLILIHGGSDDADTWMLNAPDFSEYYSVYALDLRGHGKSVANHGAHVHRLGADLHEFIEAIGAPKVNLCGWSMGCSVIWSYIEIFGQEKINKVVFDDEPVALVANPKYKAADIIRTGSTRMDPWLISNTLDEYGCEWTPEGSPITEAYEICFNRGILFFDEETSKQIPDGYWEKICQRPEMAETQKKFVSRLMLDHFMLDWSDLIPQITVPSVYITGDLSIVTTHELGKWMSETMKDCKWVRFTAEEYGIHDLCQTAYKKFNKVVLDFLNE